MPTRWKGLLILKGVIHADSFRILRMNINSLQKSIIMHNFLQRYISQSKWPNFFTRIQPSFRPGFNLRSAWIRPDSANGLTTIILGLNPLWNVFYDAEH